MLAGVEEDVEEEPEDDGDDVDDDDEELDEEPLSELEEVLFAAESDAAGALSVSFFAAPALVRLSVL